MSAIHSLTSDPSTPLYDGLLFLPSAAACYLLPQVVIKLRLRRRPSVGSLWKTCASICKKNKNQKNVFCGKMEFYLGFGQKKQLHMSLLGGSMSFWNVPSMQMGSRAGINIPVILHFFVENMDEPKGLGSSWTKTLAPLSLETQKKC